MKGRKNTYWLDFKVAILSASKGLVLTIIHFRDALSKKKRRGTGVADESYFDYDKGIVTLQYPREKLPVPDNGRYKLHNEIDDCIVCDKCAKVCPVDCIDIEPIKSPQEIRKTSDGSSVRMYAAKFDIDMAKCCFCGLCTTVCPTECLTMTKEYDFSEFELSKMNYEFSDMTENDKAKRQEEYDLFTLAKAREKEQAKANTAEKKPVLKPKIGGVPKPKVTGTPKPKIPGAKPVMKKPSVVIPKPKTESGEDKPKPKVVIPKPKLSGTKPKVVIPKPKVSGAKPKVVIPKPKLVKKEDQSKKETETKPKSIVPKPKIPALKPVIPKPKKDEE